MATVDLTVRGAGIFGLSVAWAALLRGARVRVVDPHGVAAGASGGVVGALAPHTPDAWNAKKAFQFDSLVLAEPFWRQVEATSGLVTGYARLGRLQPLADERAVDMARAREASAQEVWQGRFRWSVVDATQAGAWAPPSPTGLLVHDDLSARLAPLAACHALAAAIAMRGGEILRDGADDGAVLWATGAAGLHALSGATGRPAGGGVKGQAAVLHFDAREMPQVFAGGLHIVPHADGTVAVGSTSERDYADPTGTDAALDAVIEQAVAAMPVLHGARVVRRWAGLRPRSRSRAPILGPWPGRPGHFIANGGFKIGFGVAPKVAEVMADLILDGRDTIPDDFRVEASL
ncbi:NAD(P)/FAD-dependent oxidoreductase [Palleronia sp. KMU-117]|uniref:NAD(P)/FAD-dependent oxidoreductase n=1 Tax=Palleronia sp. KMU-117 TaxID=3434108 RepID=UPI003D73D7F7